MLGLFLLKRPETIWIYTYINWLENLIFFKPRHMVWGKNRYILRNRLFIWEPGRDILTGRDDCRDPASTILSSRSVFCVYMEPGRFSSRPGWPGSRYELAGSRQNGTLFLHVNSLSRINRDDKIITLWKVLCSNNRMNTYVCLVFSLTTMFIYILSVCLYVLSDVIPTLFLWEN